MSGGVDQIPAGGSALTFDEYGRPFILMKVLSHPTLALALCVLLLKRSEIVHEEAGSS